MYRQTLVRTDSGYHIPTTDESVAGIKAYFYSDTIAGLTSKMDSGDAESNVILKMADYLVFWSPSMAVDPSSQSGQMYGDMWLPGGLSAITWVHYLSLYSEEVRCNSDLIALIQHGFSKPLPSHLMPSPEAMRLITACRSSGLFLYMFDQLSLLGMNYTLISMYQFVFDLVAPRKGRPASRESPIVFFFVKFLLDQGMGVPGPLLVAYNGMRTQLSCSFLQCANPTCEHNKLDKSTGKVKFKKCSRCQAVIYCSRECQVAHYPEHKAQCRKAVDVEKGAEREFGEFKEGEKEQE